MVKVAFVLGGANTLHNDMEQAYALVTPDTVIATNHAGKDYDGILEHWCTLHTEFMPDWVKQRREAGFPDALQFWTSNTKTIPPEHEGLYKNVPSWNGSSGLLAIQVALELGYEKIILCGIPLDKKAEHYNYTGDWMDAPRYRSAWTKNIGILKGKVKSFNGYTERILGVPTLEWLYENNN